MIWLSKLQSTPRFKQCSFFISVCSRCIDREGVRWTMDLTHYCSNSHPVYEMNMSSIYTLNYIEWNIEWAFQNSTSGEFKSCSTENDPSAQLLGADQDGLSKLVLFALLLTHIFFKDSKKEGGTPFLMEIDCPLSNSVQLRKTFAFYLSLF